MLVLEHTLWIGSNIIPGIPVWNKGIWPELKSGETLFPENIEIILEEKARGGTV
jgi:hypothetical protein